MAGIIKVAIVEDEREVREGLASLIDGTGGFQCVQRFASMEEALENTGLDLPDVMLVDIGLPGMSGIDGVRALKQRYPPLLLLMLTVYKDNEHVFQALCAGACGYLLKNTPPAKLLESLREVVGGGAPMSPEVARRVIDVFHQFQPTSHAECHLSRQEMRLLKLLAEGHHYKTAATELGISVRTVAFHTRGIYQKLQVHSKSEAVAKALRSGLVR
ncbi:MAG TPA: response regulator transcription factor [Terracidiphilus sp.]|jgi:DNA-binding NarL/FixJ family response regulator